MSESPSRVVQPWPYGQYPRYSATQLMMTIMLLALLLVSASDAPEEEEDEQIIIGDGDWETEIVGALKLLGPEDLIYDPKSQLMYTGCADGWIKEITLNKSSPSSSQVRNLIFVGGRPLGLALGHHHNFIVANADEGLQNVSMKNGKVKVLTNQTNGVRFKLTDGVDVAKDGTIYFTDASYKYNLQNFMYDLLEGKPHGRFMSYHPSTKKTKVLVNGLYFANGVAVSPNQNYVVFCETVKSRCRKYYIRGDRRGTVVNFTGKLPAMPDNIHYDGDGHYWIALTTGMTKSMDVALSDTSNSGGFMIVDLKGRLISHYYGSILWLASSVIKVGHHLYCGSLVNPFILRLNNITLKQHHHLRANSSEYH